MVLIGIDPGFSGGIVIINDTKIISHSMPIIKSKKASGKQYKTLDADSISNLLKPLKDAIIVVETVHAMPGQGVTGMFNFGQSYGTIIGIASGLSIPIEYVTPQTWKKHYNIIGKDKDASRELASKLSGLSFSRKKDEGPAEAYLIANWGLETGFGKIK